jgi:UDP-N-acetylbacillosamine N-acetyltransferase
MNSKLVIFGCGGHARSVADVAITSGWEDIIFVDQKAQPQEKIMGFPVICEYLVNKHEKTDYFVGIGDNIQRESQFNRLNQSGISPVNIISPFAYISKSAKLGCGIFVGNHANIGPEAIIHDDSIINTHSVIEHECNIGFHVHIAIGALIAGRSKIGDFCFIGAGAIIRDGKEVTTGTVIGAGGVVVTDIIEKGTYVGIPVKKRDKFHF